ncbi:MAG: DUF3017 domain-containing protein [Streptosporangiaceae bacterium]|nr:DUF3017 domain-containing protein [Streptosporangiaceae bacterium]MBV9855541.1 DUF3017 domain-containing protein [Streptosporangiaceae bacterium]
MTPHTGRAEREPAGTRQPEARQARARRAPRREAPPLSAVPYLAVLACTAIGLLLAWRVPSTTGDPAGVMAGLLVAGGGLLAAAVARLILPQDRAGLLACRRRYLDVLTLALFGISLVVMGLVLPRLPAASLQEG